MALDSFNTRGGEVGFSVAFSDGGHMTEKDGSWDDVPLDRPIQSVAISHFGTEADYVRLKGFDSYFFSNEAYMARDGGKSTHAAKILGGAREGAVSEVRVDFGTAKPGREQRSYPRSDCSMLDSAFRPGAVAV